MATSKKDASLAGKQLGEQVGDEGGKERCRERLGPEQGQG
jgi:hypothetical protein